jgi:deoxyribodipyrimidine photo-lyase
VGRTSLVWFLQDLRLADNPALIHACLDSDTIIPVYLWTPEEYGGWMPGAASRWWLHESLGALDRDLRGRGSRLVLHQGGTALELLRSLIRETGADTVYWNARYEP